MSKGASSGYPCIKWQEDQKLECNLYWKFIGILVIFVFNNCNFTIYISQFDDIAKNLRWVPHLRSTRGTPRNRGCALSLASLLKQKKWHEMRMTQSSLLKMIFFSKMHTLSHNTNPITHTWGWVIGCLLWVLRLVYVILLSLLYWAQCQRLNSSPPGQDGRHFADDIFTCIFVNEKFRNLIKISSKFVPKCPIVNNPALV